MDVNSIEKKEKEIIKEIKDKIYKYPSKLFEHNVSNKNNNFIDDFISDVIEKLRYNSFVIKLFMIICDNLNAKDDNLKVILFDYFDNKMGELTYDYNDDADDKKEEEKKEVMVMKINVSKMKIKINDDEQWKEIEFNIMEEKIENINSRDELMNCLASNK